MTFVRKIRFPLFAILAVLAFSMLSACRKNGEEITALLSDTESSEIIESVVSDRTAGASLTVNDMSQMIGGVLDQCGVPGDTAFSRSNATATAGYNYNYQLNWLINCNNLNVPQTAHVNAAGQGNFNSTRWNGSNQSATELVFTELALSAPNYIANGTYNFSGTVTGNLRHLDPTLNCNVAMNLSDLTINKSSFAITGGTGTAEISVSNGQGQTQTVEATLVFNTDGTVTVTVNGHSFTY